MHFVFKRINLDEDILEIDQIHRDVLDGDCAIVYPINSKDYLSSSIKYIVVDYDDHLLMIFPGTKTLRQAY